MKIGEASIDCRIVLTGLLLGIPVILWTPTFLLAQNSGEPPSLSDQLVEEMKPPDLTKYKPCPQPAPKEFGSVQVHGTSATVVARGPSPLADAIASVSKRYGWTVDFEDPYFTSALDKCRTNGVLLVASTFFRGTYSETKDLRRSDTEEERVLRKIVSDYNKGGNPGKFGVRNESNGRFSVVGEYAEDDRGHEQRIAPALDTRISIPFERRKVYLTIEMISEELAASGAPVGSIPGDSAAFPSNANAESLAGGNDTSARNLLARAIDTGDRKISWRLNCVTGSAWPRPSCILEFSPYVTFPGELLTEKAPLLTYDSPHYGFSFKYPPNYMLTKSEPDAAEVNVSMPVEAYPNSTLSEALFSIGVKQHVNQKGCNELLRSLGQTGAAPVTPKRPNQILINDIQFEWAAWAKPFASKTDPGGEHYVSFQNGICYEILLEWWINNVGDYVEKENGTVFLDVDFDDLHRRLRAIVSTVDIRPPREKPRATVGVTRP